MQHHLNHRNCLILFKVVAFLLVLAKICQCDQKNQERKLIAHNMNRYRNRRINPCEDFYEYACGNWLTQQEILLTKSGDLVSVQKQVELKVKQQLQQIFEEPITSLEALHLRNLKNFFRSCKVAESNSPIQKKFLHDFLRKNGGVPFLSTTGWQEEYQWLQIIAYLRRYYGLNILISIDIEKNPTSMRSNIVLNEPKTILLPMEVCSSIALHRDYDHTEDYNRLQTAIRDNLKIWFELKDSIAVRLAGDITNFQFDLCKYMNSQHTILEIGPSYTRYMESRQRLTATRIHGVQQQYNTNPPKNLLHLSKEFNINFKEYVDICLDTNFNAQVQLRNEPYFRHLNRLVKSQPMQSFANYIMYVALNSINFPLNELPGSRPLYCVDKCLDLFPEIIGQLYNQHFEQTDIKEDVEAIHQQIKNAFLKNIEIDWINQNTKRILKQKLAQIQLTFPIYEDAATTTSSSILDIQNLDYWHKLEVLMGYKSNQTLQKHQTLGRSNMVESIAVDLNLNLLSNDIQIGWGLLQPPLYSINYPAALKYAYLGHRLAREFFKVFEWAWDSNYSMHWDATAAADFHHRTNCFQTQTSNYLYNRPLAFRNITKLHELIADNAGLNNAFAAYINWLEAIPSANYEILHRETLHNLNLTNTQLFFLHFAQSRCSAKWLLGAATAPHSYHYFPLDRHTSERYEINGPLSNNIEFSRDFHCPIGTNMHSNDKCLIY